METAKEVVMHFNTAKCQFRQTEVKFFSMMLTKKGVVPDPAKLEALKKMSEARNENLLQSFPGIMNYLLRFNPVIANLTHSLSTLMKKDNEFIWNETHSKDFKSIIWTLCEMKNYCVIIGPDLNYFLKQMQVE